MAGKQDQLHQPLAAYSLLFHPLPPGETSKVAIFSGNRLEWVHAFYAAWKNEAVLVPIDFMAPAKDVAYILNDCRPEVIFCSRDNPATFELARKMLNYDIKVYLFEDQKYNIADYVPLEINISDLQKTAVIIYTSGTTGSPKGVMPSFDNLQANIEAVSCDIPIFTTTRLGLMAQLPLHHILPLMGTLIAPISVGATVAFSPSRVSDDIITTLQNNGIRIIIGVPRLYKARRKGIMDKIISGILPVYSSEWQRC